jgi:hypothetical protein
MNETNNYIGDENLSFRQIILGHIDKILKLSLMNISNNHITFKYKNAVLSLGDSLSAYFDNDMKEAELEFEKERHNEKNNLNSYRFYFRALLNLVKRVDHFKNDVYGEDKDELVSDDEESEVLEND